MSPDILRTKIEPKLLVFLLAISITACGTLKEQGTFASSEDLAKPRTRPASTVRADASSIDATSIDRKSDHDFIILDGVSCMQY